MATQALDAKYTEIHDRMKPYPAVRCLVKYSQGLVADALEGVSY
jgi:hypothetical protein